MTTNKSLKDLQREKLLAELQSVSQPVGNDFMDKVKGWHVGAAGVLILTTGLAFSGGFSKLQSVSAEQMARNEQILSEQVQVEEMQRSQEVAQEKAAIAEARFNGGSILFPVSETDRSKCASLSLSTQYRDAMGGFLTPGTIVADLNGMTGEIGEEGFIKPESLARLIFADYQSFQLWQEMVRAEHNYECVYNNAVGEAVQ